MSWLLSLSTNYVAWLIAKFIGLALKDLCIEKGDLELVITRESEFGRQT